jgi:hypothetical protein
MFFFLLTQSERETRGVSEEEMGVDREREGRKEGDPAGGWATGLGGRRRRTGRPRTLTGDVSWCLFPMMFFFPVPILVNPFFFLWVSFNIGTYTFLGGFWFNFGVDFLDKPVDVVGKFWVQEKNSVLVEVGCVCRESGVCVP